MHAAQVCHHHAADHDVVEMGDDEICVVDVDVHSERREKRPVRPPMVNSPMKPNA